MAGKRTRAAALLVAAVALAAVLAGCGAEEKKGGIADVSKDTLPFYGINYRTYGEGAEYRPNQPVTVQFTEDGRFITTQLEVKDVDGEEGLYIVGESEEPYSFNNDMSEVSFGEFTWSFEYDPEGRYIILNGVKYSYYEEDNEQCDYSNTTDAGPGEK